MPNVNLFTNGILLGDLEFCDKYLPLWKSLGLTNFAVSIHHDDRYEQEQIYGIEDYPLYRVIVENVKKYGIGVRATLLLRKGGIDTPKKFKNALKFLTSIGIVNITSWSVGEPNGSRNKYTPSRWNMFKIRRWLHKNAILCHGHVWGGGVYDLNGTLIRITDYVTKHNPNKDFVRQLIVLQDGGVYYSWIKEGAICQKG